MKSQASVKITMKSNFTRSCLQVAYQYHSQTSLLQKKFGQVQLLPDLLSFACFDSISSYQRNTFAIIQSLVLFTRIILKIDREGMDHQALTR